VSAFARSPRSRLESSSRAGCIPFAEYENEIDEKTIQEQYRVWKKNVPYLYDTMVTAGLDWPSLTVQFFGEREVTAGSDFSTHKVLLGTHTSGEEPNHLMIAKVLLPNENAVIDESKYDDERVELGGYAASKPKFEIVQRIVHDREVNRARICPQNSFLIATKSPSADVLVFDTGKHPLRPADAHRNTCRPNLRLKGHELEGYGLAWNDKKPGEIISGGDDKLICFWDITGSPVYSAGSSSSGSSSSSASSSSSPAMSATRIIRGHKEVVEDVAWHRHHPEMFGSVGDDSMLMV
jgi:histone-binding protein RBBP4